MDSATRHFPSEVCRTGCSGGSPLRIGPYGGKEWGATNEGAAWRADGNEVCGIRKNPRQHLLPGKGSRSRKASRRQGSELPGGRQPDAVAAVAVPVVVDAQT